MKPIAEMTPEEVAEYIGWPFSSEPVEFDQGSVAFDFGRANAAWMAVASHCLDFLNAKPVAPEAIDGMNTIMDFMERPHYDEWVRRAKARGVQMRFERSADVEQRFNLPPGSLNEQPPQ